MDKLLSNPTFEVLGFIGLAFTMNAVVYGLGWNRESRNRVYSKQEKEAMRLLPPGYVIGGVWMVLFGLFGYIHYLLYVVQHKISTACVVVELLVLFCLLYPVLTSLQDSSLMRVLNLLSLVFGFMVGLVVITVSVDAFWYLVPYLLWTFYVCYVGTYGSQPP